MITYETNRHTMRRWGVWDATVGRMGRDMWGMWGMKVRHDGRGVWDGTGGACGTGRVGHVGWDGRARGMRAARWRGHLGCAGVGIWDVMGGMA